MVERVRLRRQRGEPGLGEVVRARGRERPREEPAEARRDDLGGAEAGGGPRADAAAARDELADRLLQVSGLDGVLAASCASPSTNGARTKLVTSSRASVRAALNVARTSAARSSHVRSRGSRVERAPEDPGAGEAAGEGRHDRRVGLVGRLRLADAAGRAGAAELGVSTASRLVVRTRPPVNPRRDG